MPRPCHSQLIALFITLAAPAAFAQAAPTACPAFEPGKRLGDRFSVGTELKEASAVAPDAIPGWVRPTNPAGKAVRLRLDAGKKLVEFEHPLPACVTLNGKAQQTPDIHALAAALGTCGPEAINEGANVIECAGATLVTSAGKASVRVLAKAAPAATCAVYVRGSGWADATGTTTKPGAARELAGAALCLPNAKAPLGPDADITAFKALGRPCKEDARLGGTHLFCDGLTYSFAGPKLVLSRLTIGPIQ